MKALVIVLAGLLLLSGCEVVDLFGRPNGPLAGSATSDPGMTWQTDGLSPPWRVVDGSAGFTSAAAPGKPRRAFIDHGADDVAVEWLWAGGGQTAKWTSGLLHTDPSGPVDSGLRVYWLWGSFILAEGGETLAIGPPTPAPGPSDTGRLEVVGDEVRYIHNGLASIDWVTWSGSTTGYHGILAHDSGLDASQLQKVWLVGFDTLAATERPYYLPHDIDITGATDQTTLLNSFVASVPDGATIRFPRNATIWSQQLDLFERDDLTIEGSGSTLWQRALPPPDQPLFIVPSSGLPRASLPVVLATRGRNLTIENLQIRGSFPVGGPGQFSTAMGLEPGSYAGTSRVWSHGLQLSGVNGAQILDVNISEVLGDGILISDDILGNTPENVVPSKDILIRGGGVRKTGRQGVVVVSGLDITIEGHSATDRYELDEIARSMVDLEPGGIWERIDGVTMRHIQIGTGASCCALAAQGAGPPRTRGTPVQYTAQDELPLNAPAHVDTQPEYLADPRGFRRINNVTLDDWHLADRPFTMLVGENRTTADGQLVTSRRHGWTFNGIVSMLDTGDRSNGAGALATLWQVDTVHFDNIRARFGPQLPMHFARLASGDGTPARWLTIGPNMDLGGTNGAGSPYPAAYAGDILYNGTTVNGPHP